MLEYIVTIWVDSENKESIENYLASHLTDDDPDIDICGWAIDDR